jgi:hypothetical protein
VGRYDRESCVWHMIIERDVWESRWLRRGFCVP